MTDQSSDPRVRQFREQISDRDRVIVEAFNERLRLVAELKRYKESRGYDFVDSARERSMLGELAEANRGPLSGEGLAELLRELLDLTKRELAREPG